MQSRAARTAFMIIVLIACTAGSAWSAPCLTCHSDHALSVRFDNAEELSAFIDTDKMRASAHAALECTDCHRDMKGQDRHPQRHFKSKHQYRIKSASICTMCHRMEDMKAKAFHESLSQNKESGEPPVCSSCHSAHEVMPLAGGSIQSTQKDNCMRCHAVDARLHFRDGERISTMIDQGRLSASAHGSLSCSDCHYGFSSENHPVRQFKSRRSFRVTSSETCKRCHFDKYAKSVESIHAKVMRDGDESAPTCVDCHGSHGVASTKVDHLANARKCRTCHEGIYERYAASVHGDSLVNKMNPDVPICSNCHSAHSVQDTHGTGFHERIPELCGNCHADKKIAGKYGLSTNVVRTYLSDFHGVTFSLQKKAAGKAYLPDSPIAVCTDCHGVHDIERVSTASPQDIRARLLKRCQSCHGEASITFPDAWLSHYEPSLSNAPAVFLINTAYKIAMPIMVLGLLLQIFLHIWRYMVNR